MQIDLSSAEPFEIASIRPPTENQSLAFRLTRNCYWNHCALENLIRRIDSAREETGRISQEKTQVPPSVSGDPILSWFLQWINETPTISDSINHLLFWRLAGGKTCFLGDADSLILKPRLIHSVITAIKKHFPSIQRFTVYGRTATAARTRSLSGLKEYRESGLDRKHFGIESGSDTVLKFVKKGETRADHLKGCLKIKDAGISCSVYVMPGLGGAQWSEAHARETASLLSEYQWRATGLGAHQQHRSRAFNPAGSGKADAL